MKKPTTLIIGGSSGLGFEIASLLGKSHTTYITGRSLKPDDTSFILDLSSAGSLPAKIDQFFEDFQTPIDLLIYAAGFGQEAEIYNLTDNEIEDMIAVGLRAPSLFLQRILRGQGRLGGFIAITSTSQRTPRQFEPIYTAVKAGLGMLANSLSLDVNVGKVLVAAPGGMRTAFWKKTTKRKRDLSMTSDFLDPVWVAEQILHSWNGNFQYKEIQILRNPARMTILEERK